MRAHMILFFIVCILISQSSITLEINYPTQSCPNDRPPFTDATLQQTVLSWIPNRWPMLNSCPYIDFNAISVGWNLFGQRCAYCTSSQSGCTWTQFGCIPCRMCSPGSYMITSCSQGTDTVCSTNGCVGGLGGSWCRGGQKFSCPPTTPNGNRVYNLEKQAWGHVVEITPCTSNYPPVYGWCRECPNDMLTVNRCSLEVSRIGSYVSTELAAGRDPIVSATLPSQFSSNFDLRRNRRTFDLGQACRGTTPFHFFDARLLYTFQP